MASASMMKSTLQRFLNEKRDHYKQGKEHFDTISEHEPAILHLYEITRGLLDENTGSSDTSYNVLHHILSTPMVDSRHKPDQRLRAFVKVIQQSAGDCTPLPEDIAKGVNVHSQLQDSALLHRYELEVGNIVNSSEFALQHPTAHEALLEILNLLKDDSKVVLKGQPRKLTIDKLVELVNNRASQFVSLEEFTHDDADAESSVSLQNSLAMFSHTNANTQNSTGGGRSRQSRGASSKGGNGNGSKGGKGGDGQNSDKGAPRKTPHRSKEEKLKHRTDHQKNSATRFYGDRTRPDKSNVGDGTHQVTDLIQCAMQLFGILLELTTQEDNVHMPENCKLDSAILDDVFEYVSLALDNAMLRSNTDKSKTSARNSVEIPPGTSEKDIKKLRNAAANKVTASVPTGDNHSATMIRIPSGKSLPPELYAPLKAAWNNVRTPLHKECQLVLEFLRRDEFFIR